MSREHKMIEGYDFMSMEWCGGCETCDQMYCAPVCLACSYSRKGYPKDYGMKFCPLATPWPKRSPKPQPTPTLIHNGGKP